MDTKMLLAIAGLLTFTGGLYAAIYNCRWYDDFGDRKRTWGGIDGQMADCAGTSGVFGCFTAIAGLAGFSLMIMGTQGIITTIVFGVSLVFYLCMMIPEAVILSKGIFGFSSAKTFSMPLYTTPRYEDDEDFRDWYMGGYERAVMYNSPAEPSEELVRQKEWFQSYVLNDLVGYSVFRRVGVSRCKRAGDTSSLEAFYERVCGDETKVQEYPLNTYSVGTMKPCVINYNESVLPKVDEDGDVDDCGKIKIVAECHGRWNKHVLTRRAKSKCKEQVKYQKMRMKPMADQFVYETKVNRHDWYENVKTNRITGLPEQTRIMLSIQTIAFVITAAGVALSFFGGSAADAATDAVSEP